MGEMESTSLLNGHLYEREAAVIFQEALLAWCGGDNAAAAATAACGIAWCNSSWTWPLVAAPQCLRFAGPSDTVGARDSLNFVAVALLSKFVCPGSEICSESHLNEGCTCLGFCETRETDPLPECLLCGRHASSSSGFGFRVYPCLLLPDPRHERFPGGFSE